MNAVATSGPQADAPGPAGVGGLLAGRYRMQERLGEDTGSEVWRGTDEVLRRPVLLRTFPARSAQAVKVAAAARAACRITDRRLEQVIDADEYAERPYLVTDWPRGTRLDDMLSAGPLGAMRAAQIIAQAAEALAIAQESGVAHLCLGPESLRCDARGQVEITGLGIAAALAGAAASDPALADTRGLGRLLYAALTGYWPGPGQTVLPPAPCRDGQICRPRQVRPSIPARVDAVACRALGTDVAAPPILGLAQLAMELTAITRQDEPGATGSPVPDLTVPLGAANVLPGRLARTRRRLAGGRTGRPLRGGLDV